MGVKLVSASGGSVEINPPATASNFVATMPAGTGTVSVNGVSSNIVLATAQASTSGTSIDFTGIPSWVRRITVMLNGVSTNGTSNVQLQIGAGSIDTTSYFGGALTAPNAAANVGANNSSGFLVTAINAATVVLHGSMILSYMGSNIWSLSGIAARSDGANHNFFGGTKTLSGTLDRVRITTVNGTDAFDAGTINIMYE